LLPTTPISLELRDAEIKDVLRTLGQQFHLNLLVQEDTKGLVTVSMRNVPLRDALQTLADIANLIIIPAPGDILMILPVKAYEESLKARATLAAQAETLTPAALPPLITQKIDVQYAYDPRRPISSIAKELGIGDERKNLNELVEGLRKYLSGRPGSNISVISRTNALLVTDMPENVAEIANLLNVVDVPSVMVGIEARITEIGTQGLTDLGIQWGGVGRYNTATVAGGGNGATTGVPPTVPQSGAVGLSGSNFIVNFPAALLSTGGTSLAFVLGRQATKVLDVQLTAVAQKGLGKLLATPRLTTPDHEHAMIESGREIPYVTQQISGGIVTNTVEFKKATLDLEVTPHVIVTDTPRSLFLEVAVTRREPDFANAVQGNPALFTRTLFTRALVKEGETAVIGGLTQDDATDSQTEIPFLGRLPVLGWLFRDHRKTETKLQLMIFITPVILPTPIGGVDPASLPSAMR
jgi:type IV pilus assembly protein PilQ